MKQKIISLSNLNIKYNTKVILEDVNLNIYKNDFLIIMGNSGSGKSTLLDIISGLKKDYSGNVNIISKLNTAFVFQDPYTSFNPKRKIVDQLKEVIPKNKREKYIDIINENISFINLDIEKIYNYPNRLSGGELQRLSLLRSILQEPDIILLDEPTSALDVVNQKNILSILKKLHDELFITIVMVTHDFKFLKHIGERVIIIHDKKIIFDDESKNLTNSKIPYIQELEKSYTYFKED